MIRRNRTHTRLVLINMVLSLVSVTAIVSFIIVNKSNRTYKSEVTEKSARLRVLETEKNDWQEEIDAVRAELNDKKAYIEEWDAAYQQLTEAIEEKANAQTAQDPANSSGQNSVYADLYPDLNVTQSDQKNSINNKKVVHLTFDDGPSEKTGEVLDALDVYGIKATFFVTYTGKEELKKYYKEIVDRGHTIAIHTASHDYKKIYASVEAYLEDFNKIYQLVYAETGVRPVLFRYPGGSLNLKGYSAGAAIKNEMDRRGFVYFDWNVSSGDGGNQATEESILQWITEGVGKHSESVVLMHDTRTPTVAILPRVLQELTEMGGVFEPLDNNSRQIQFYDKNY